MASKEGCQSAVRHKRSPAEIIAIVCLVAAIGVFSGAVTVFVYVAPSPIESAVSSADVLAGCFVSGDDLIVQIQEGGSADSLVLIELVVDGYDVPPSLCIHDVPTGMQYPKTVIYDNIAAGMNGDLRILFKGTFKDGTRDVIRTNGVRCM
ncbi:MAG: hypothetical protein Q4Q04_06440 [Methanocorpusculum sp.]|nr:hypothetical protein [Methanocorpusculum sp.]